jgi:hypothetical protein
MNLAIANQRQGRVGPASNAGPYRAPMAVAGWCQPDRAGRGWTVARRLIARRFRRSECDFRRTWAEGVGFEPTMTVTRHTGFQDQRTRPLCEPSRRPRRNRSKPPTVEDSAPAPTMDPPGPRLACAVKDSAASPQPFASARRLVLRPAAARPPLVPGCGLGWEIGVGGDVSGGRVWR